MNNLQELKVNTRIVIAFLWTAMLFIFAYVDIFGLLDILIFIFLFIFIAAASKALETELRFPVP